MPMIELKECNNLKWILIASVPEYTNIKPLFHFPRKHVQHLLLHILIRYPMQIKGHPFPWAKRGWCSDPALFAFKKFAKCLERDINPSLESEILEVGTSHDIVLLLNKYLQEFIDIKRLLVFIPRGSVVCDR